MTADKVISEPAQALNSTVSRLHHLSLAYFMVGSFASGIRGEFRATNDIDIVVKLPSSLIDKFIQLFSQDFYCDELAIPKAIESRQSFNIIHKENFVKVDFFTKIGDLEEDQFKRATEVKIPGSDNKVKTSTTEYNILAKLRWYLKSNRQLEMQIRDVKGMIEINRRTIDYQYLRDWANRLNLTDILEEMLEVK